MSESLPTRVRQGYGFGAVAIAIANTSMMFFLLKYLVDVARLPAATAGLVLFVGKGWDAFADPLAGWLSDRTQSRMGARRPWVLFGSVPFAATFIATFWGFDLHGTQAAVGYAVLLLLFNAAYSAVVIPYGALTASLTHDLPAEEGDPSPGYKERTRLNGARMAWSMVGGIVSGVAMPILFNHYSWRVAGLVLGLCIAPPLWIAVAATRGRDRNGSTGEGPGMWSVLRNPEYRRVVAQFCASWTVVATLSSIVPFYVEHHLHRKDLLDALFAAIQISALVCIPGIVWLAGRWDKPRAYALAMASWSAVLLGLALIPEGNAGAAIAVACLVGPGVAAAHVLPWAMLPDVVEHDQARTGVDRSGQFYGMMTFMEKVVLAATLWGVGGVLGASGYLEGAAQQPESARLAVLALIGPLPGLVLAGAAVNAWLWPRATAT